MPDLEPVVGMPCACDCYELAVIGILKGFLYTQCMECQTFMKWRLLSLDEQSYKTEEVEEEIAIEQETLRFEIPDKTN